MTYVRQLQFWLNRDRMPMTIAALENALINLHCERLGVNSCFLYYGAILTRYH